MISLQAKNLLYCAISFKAIIKIIQLW